MVRVVAGAIVRDGRVLAARRAPGTRQAGLWELPGGKVEAGERDEDALRRELVEELELEVEVGVHLAEAVHTYPHLQILLVAYACTAEPGEPAHNDHDAFLWVTPEEGAALEWAPADVPLLPAVWTLLSPS